MTREIPPQVNAVYNAFPKKAQNRLKELRALIFAEAEANPAIGPLTETLKWGEPSYLTEKTKSGTTIRLAWKPAKPDQCALLVNCQSTLVSDWRELYGSVFKFEGKRAIIFDLNAPYPADAVRHCIALALTYHLNRAAA